MDHRLEVRLELTKTRLLGLVLKACATWPGSSVQDKLQVWLNRLPPKSGFSLAWQKHGQILAAPIDDQQILGELAAEVFETMQRASMTDSELAGDDSSQPYVLLAEAEAIASVLQFGGGKIDLKRIGSFLWRLGVPRESRSASAKGEGGGNAVALEWREAALIAAITRVEGLLGTRNLKVRAAAEVTLAQLLFLSASDGPSRARKHLLEEWEPIKQRVENHILHDSVSDLRHAYVPPRTICVISMEDANGKRSYKQMEGDLQHQVLQKLDDLGLTEGVICDWLKMRPNGIRAWKVKNSGGSRHRARRKTKPELSE